VDIRITEEHAGFIEVGRIGLVVAGKIVMAGLERVITIEACIVEHPYWLILVHMVNL
jgi:hypothetical protein